MNSLEGGIRLLIVDDHDLVQAGFVQLLMSEKDMRIVGEARTCAEAVEKTKALSPNVVLVDVNVPAIGNIETVAMIGRTDPDVRILIVSMSTAKRICGCSRSRERGAAFQRAALRRR